MTRINRIFFQMLNVWLPAAIILGLFASLWFRHFQLTTILCILLFVIFLGSAIQKRLLRSHVIENESENSDSIFTKFPLGHLEISSRELEIGDADLPPRGAKITGIPVGRYYILGIGESRRAKSSLASFVIYFGDAHTTQRAPNEVYKFFVDTGAVTIMDPILLQCASPKRKAALQKDFRKRIAGGLDATVNPDIFHLTSLDENAVPRAVTFECGYGDGEYAIEVWRVDGVVTKIACNFVNITTSDVRVRPTTPSRVMRLWGAC